MESECVANAHFQYGNPARLLRDLGCEASPYVHRFHLDPQGPNSRGQTILFEALVRRESEGEYRLGTATLEGTNAHGSWSEVSILTREASADPARIALRHSSVGLAYSQTRPPLDWELVCQAFAREDGNQIVQSIESLIGLAYETNRVEDVAALRAMRMDFIRGGFFGLASLSRLWALAHATLELPSWASTCNRSTAALAIPCACMGNRLANDAVTHLQGSS